MPPAETPLEPGAPHGSTRAIPRTLVVLAAALFVARVVTGVLEPRPAATGAPAANAPERVRWVPIADAAAVSRKTGKPILYDFSAEWCGPCRSMSHDVFADAGAAHDIERAFVPVRVLDRQREEGRNPPAVDSLQRAFGIDAFPTLVVATPGRGPFEHASGYGGRAATLEWLAESERTERARGGAAAPDTGATE